MTDLADGETTEIKGSGKKPYVLRNIGVTYEGGRRDLSDGEIICVEPDDNDPCPTEGFFLLETTEDLPGIYVISNVVNSKWYIGSSKHVRTRLRRHRYKLRHGEHCNKHLQRAWNLYGEECFTGFLLEYCAEEDLITREQFYLDCRNPDYNMARIAGSTKGMKHPKRGPMPAPQREKIGKASRGRKHSAEARARMSNVRRGVPKSTEFRKAVSRTLSGRPKSAAHKKALSEARKGQMTPLGKQMSEKSHCPHGHEYTPENTWIQWSRGRKSRVCRACKCKREREKYRHKKQGGSK
jgi:group I intron endonuclease